MSYAENLTTCSWGKQDHLVTFSHEVHSATARIFVPHLYLQESRCISKVVRA